MTYPNSSPDLTALCGFSSKPANQDLLQALADDAINNFTANPLNASDVEVALVAKLYLRSKIMANPTQSGMNPSDLIKFLNSSVLDDNLKTSLLGNKDNIKGGTINDTI